MAALVDRPARKPVLTPHIVGSMAEYGQELPKPAKPDPIFDAIGKRFPTHPVDIAFDGKLCADGALCRRTTTDW